MISEIIDAERSHVNQIFRSLRRGHLDNLIATGLTRRVARREFLKVFDESAFRKSWIVDGKLAAVGGVTGSVLSPFGFVWLALSDDVIRFPLSIVKESRRQLGKIMESKTELATTILVNDEKAMRFSAFLGFHSKHDEALKTWRDHLRVFKENTERLPVESGFAIAIGYHREAA